MYLMYRILTTIPPISAPSKCQPGKIGNLIVGVTLQSLTFPNAHIQWSQYEHAAKCCNFLLSRDLVAKKKVAHTYFKKIFVQKCVAKKEMIQEGGDKNSVVINYNCCSKSVCALLFLIAEHKCLSWEVFWGWTSVSSTHCAQSLARKYSCMGAIH